MCIINDLTTNGKCFLKISEKIREKFSNRAVRPGETAPGAAPPGRKTGCSGKRERFRRVLPSNIYILALFSISGLWYTAVSAFGPFCPGARLLRSRRRNWKNLFCMFHRLSAGYNTAFKGTANCSCGRNRNRKTGYVCPEYRQTAPFGGAALSQGLHLHWRRQSCGEPHLNSKSQHWAFCGNRESPPLPGSGGESPAACSRQGSSHTTSEGIETAWACLRNCSAPVPSGK